MSKAKKHVDALNQCGSYQELYCYIRDNVADRQEACALVPYYTYVSSNMHDPIILELLELLHIESSPLAYDVINHTESINTRNVLFLRDGFLDKKWLEQEMDRECRHGRDMFNVFDRNFRLLNNHYPAIGEHIVQECSSFIATLTHEPLIRTGLTSMYPWGYPVLFDEQIMIDVPWETFCSEEGIKNNLAYCTFAMMKSPMQLSDRGQQWAILQLLRYMHPQNIVMWMNEVKLYKDKDTIIDIFQILLSKMTPLSSEKRDAWIKAIPLEYLQNCTSNYLRLGNMLMVSKEMREQIAIIVEDIVQVLNSPSHCLLDTNMTEDVITWHSIAAFLQNPEKIEETSLHW